MVKLAANLSTLFGEVPLLERFDRAARCGFAGVECTFPYDDDPISLAEARAAAGVEHVLLNAPPGDASAGDRGLAADPDRAADFDATIDTAARYAQALRCRRVHVMSGVVPAGASLAAARATATASLARAADRMADDGVTVMVEPLNPRDVPGYVVGDLDTALEIVAEVGRPNIAVQFDTYHLQLTGGDLTARFDASIDRIGHVQISSVPGRHEPDWGEVDHRFLLDHLDAVGYEGWVGCEYRPRGTTVEGLAWAAPYGIQCNST